MGSKNNTLFKLEIDQPTLIDNDEILAPQEIEVELLPPIDLTDQREVEIYNAIVDIDQRLEVVSGNINKLNSEIDSLTNHADGLDYAVAVASGIIAGIIDSVWVGEFSIDTANEWGEKKVDNFVVKIAQSQGYTGNDLAGAVTYLENKSPIVADKVTNKFGGGKQHHLRDFSHHPTPVGLFFSLLTQFTEKVYGTDVAGIFQVVPVDASDLIGKNLPEKITFGVIKWFFHMVSDMAGSSSSVAKGSVGTGLPGPLVSFLKEISSLPIFKNMNEKGYKEFSVWISKLFNGTLLGKRDEKGKITEAVKFDFRTELGALQQIGRQAIPIIVNECIVRGFYFARRLFMEIKESKIKCIADLKNINWKNTLPFKNRTVVRMLTIATGTFTAFDIADAAIRSGGFNPSCILRINFVGIGRFAIAIGTDIVMGVKKSKKENQRINLTNEQLHLMNAKIFYKEADMWIKAEDAGKSITEVYEIIEPSFQFTICAWSEIYKDMDKIKETLKKKREEEAMLSAFLEMYSNM